MQEPCEGSYKPSQGWQLTDYVAGIAAEVAKAESSTSNGRSPRKSTVIGYPWTFDVGRWEFIRKLACASSPRRTANNCPESADSATTAS